MVLHRIVMVMVCDFKFLPPARNEGYILAEKGFQVDVYTLKDKDELNNEQLAKNYYIHRIHLWSRFLPKSSFFLLIKYTEFLLRFILIEAPQKASVYVAHNLDALLFTYLIAKLKGSKIVYRAHELYTEAFKLPFVSIWRKLESYLLKHVDATMTPNDERAEIMFAEYGAKVKPTVVMNCPWYKPPIKSTFLQDYLHVRGYDKQFIVLFQGRLVSYNGIEELIDSVPYFDNEIKLILMGPITPEYLNEIKAKIELLAIKNKVIFHESVPYDVLHQITASANIGVVLYKNINRNSYFCAPNKLFEYFMAGLPVVSSNFPGLIHLVENAGCGLVVDNDNPKQIAEAINYIHNNTESYESMRINALSSAQKYNWENESKKLVQVYENLLK
jgi:glycosyltransferase involved in cell wall biosynthesis